MKTSTILKKAKALIATEKTWTQHYYALPKKGYKPKKEDLGLWGNEPEAKCFCSVGALHAVSPNNYSTAYDYLDKVARSEFDCAGMLNANDEGGFDAVHIILDEAIKRAKAAGD